MIVNENGKRYIVSVKENGDKFWYLDNQLHREAGPAVELANGSKAFYLKGKKFSDLKAFENAVKIVKTAEEKKYYDVKIECMLPATLTYRVLAKSPEEASILIKNQQPNHVQHKLIGRRDLKVMVYDTGSTLIKFIKNLTGL